MTSEIAPTRTGSQMAFETGEAPAAVARLLDTNMPACQELGRRLEQLQPPVIVTCARGSSDHAATYGKYLFETQLGIPVSSFAPSVSSVYHTQPKLKGALFVAISQSGRSPDLLKSTEAARESGAMILALVNDANSPLASLADVCLDLQAGPETSVAATKSFITSLAGLLQIAACWSKNQALTGTLAQLPNQLAKATELDWSEAVNTFSEARSMFTLGRGLGYGVAQEAALKLKETSGIHAEPFSSAELAHGPMALLRIGFPILMFNQNDGTRPGNVELAEALREKGADQFVAEEGEAAPGRLPVIPDLHPAVAPLIMIQSFYRLADKIAAARGLNPDAPRHLKKVTETL
jgi:glutamine---fructose-6-phosphate transaminase (isomerizing)